MFKFIGLVLTLLIFCSVVLVAVLNWYSFRMEFEDPQHSFSLKLDKVEIIAHRGGALERPENTHMAFLYIAKHFPRAIIELDVRITSDGHLIVMHDETLDRTTNGSGKVSANTLDTISKLNAAHNFEFAGQFPYRENLYEQLLVPKLEDVLKRYSNRMIVEIKGNLDEQLRAVNSLIRLVENLKSEDDESYTENIKSLENRLVLSSELYLPISKIRERKPNWLFAPTRPEVAYKLIPLSKLGFVRADAPIDMIFHMKSDVYCLPKSYRGREIITEDLIAELNRRKKPLYAWTINDEAEMEKLINMGINGIITDRPSVLKRVIFRLKQ